jgi:hypothetical protein
MRYDVDVGAIGSAPSPVPGWRLTNACGACRRPLIECRPLAPREDVITRSVMTTLLGRLLESHAPGTRSEPGSAIRGYRGRRWLAKGKVVSSS